MTVNQLPICPLCLPDEEAFRGQPWSEAKPLECRNCGTHFLTHEAAVNLRSLVHSPDARARIAFGLRRLPDRHHLTAAQLDRFAETPLPPALERIDNLVIHLAERCRPGSGLVVDAEGSRAWLGCEDADGVRWVIDQATARGLVSASPRAHTILTAAGWERHEALLRAGAKSRHAFMAMKFNDGQLDALFERHLVPAVAQTGFELRRLNGPHAEAGSIDNRMRVELRTSRFVVCDLTHANLGAYWEAGFAEGLGRPVFYICREDVLSKDHPQRPHFDVNHQLITTWRADDPAEDMERLKDAIRATLPSEARMEDPPKGPAAVA